MLSEKQRAEWQKAVDYATKYEVTFPVKNKTFLAVAEHLSKLEAEHQAGMEFIDANIANDRPRIASAVNTWLAVHCAVDEPHGKEA